MIAILNPKDERLSAWLGAEVGLKYVPEMGKYILVSWAQDTYNENIVREGMYIMEQSSKEGIYVDDRETFLNDWKENEYKPTGIISFAEDDFRELNETPKERLERLRERFPGVEEFYHVRNSCMEENGIYDIEVANVEQREYVKQNGQFIFRDTSKNYVDMMCYDAKDYVQARQDAWKILDELEWKSGLFVEMRRKT